MVLVPHCCSVTRRCRGVGDRFMATLTSAPDKRSYFRPGMTSTCHFRDDSDGRRP